MSSLALQPGATVVDLGCGTGLNKPFGVSLDIADRYPWESVRRHLEEVELRELCFGALYLSVGTPGSPGPTG